MEHITRIPHPRPRPEAAEAKSLTIQSVRIAVDARPFGAERTGVGRYLEGLLPAWLRAFPGDRIFLLSPRPVRLPEALAGSVEVRPGQSRLPGTLWLQSSAPVEAVRCRADVFFAPLAIVPLASPVPCVATVHDLTPFLFPEWHTRKNRLAFDSLVGSSVRKAKALFCVSRATERDLLTAFPEADGKSFVVPNGLTPPHGGAGAGGGEPGAEGRPYVLSLATREPRKNLGRLLRAMESLWDEDPGFPDLVVAGGSGWGSDEAVRAIEGSRHRDRVRLLGWVEPAEASRLLSGARLLAYPSLYEGFGLPVLEAMAAGTVVVASASSSLPEVAGDAALLPDPTDAGAIARAIETAHRDEAFRAAAVRKGRERARLFTWDAAARSMRPRFEEAAR